MATPQTPQSRLSARVRPPRRRRRLAALGAAALVSTPLALMLSGSGQAAPTLTIEQAQAQLTALQGKEEAATEAYDQGRIAVTAAQRTAAAAQARVATQRARLATLEKGIESFAVASYTNASGDPVETLLGGGDPYELVQKASAMDEVAQAEHDKLVAVEAQQQTLLAAQRTASDRQAAAQASLATLRKQKDAVDTVIAQEQAVLDHLQAQQRAALAARQAAERAAAQAQARAAVNRPAVVASVVRARPVAAPLPLPKGSGGARAALAAAYSQLGKPYAYGAAGPNAFDCSGLTMWAFGRAGISLPHSAAGQMGYGTPVPRDQLQPGDLVFFDGGGHVGIYVGGGSMIDANHSGGWVGVRPLYRGYDGARRL